MIIKRRAPFSRLELITFLEKNNIQTRPVFTGNILAQPGYRKISHRSTSSQYKNTEDVMKNAFVIASHHGLKKNQIKYLKEKFEEFLSRYK